MPKVKTSRTKPPPEGFDEIEQILEDYQRKMRDAEAESHEGKRKTESLWPIMRITHTRSRYIYDLYYKREAISRELYDWLLKEGYADANLIAKWKKQGYEKLCCARCIQSRVRGTHLQPDEFGHARLTRPLLCASQDMNYAGSTCICRVPKAQLKAGVVVECTHCGCRGCASQD
ncbi:BZ3500_MvSof-1268-A1-R1_Chr5-2g08120 [Microbotryum saponariae]|uniref:BZ3500_MvSof-1268-A1-R1_Chr5-2g08120 protein n=1 Tax=Microbotryum saponariae TaxID=289078 RepID=A0A2X0LJE6_9BASI|nr:BZ3500_MvSof-1268-A1-R1_Chr5-2g08120 [Microbotryum saponariae]SDA05989.1 BZ3501_MvSof-1269-A2-R1_Chr5-2g07942 [Microbotryum saponariae]